MANAAHIPVLLEDTVRLLAPAAGDVYVDCTAGLGGHAAAVGGALAPGGLVVLNDVDPGNLAIAAERVALAAPAVRVCRVAGNFAELPHAVRALGLRASCVLADLGFSSNQIDDGSRGLSFMRDGPLDMRLDPTLPVSAFDLVNQSPERELAQILRDLGEEELANRIARKVVHERGERPIATTGRLAEIVRAAYASAGRHGESMHPATKTFQALRIMVNDELGALDALLSGIERAADQRGSSEGQWLWTGAASDEEARSSPRGQSGEVAGSRVGGRLGARIAIISFHSLEDRRVKQSFAKLVAAGWAEALDGGTPIVGGEAEIAKNPRARSAKLRAIRLVSRG